MWQQFTERLATTPWAQLVLAFAAGLLLHLLLWAIVAVVSRRTRTRIDDAILELLKGPTRYLLPVLATQLATPALKKKLNPESYELLSDILTAATIGLLTWGLIRLGQIFEKVVMQNYGLDAPDNLAARRFYTQVRLLRKVFSFIVIVVATGLILMSFEQFKRFGTGILASAGIVGVILGLAAQRTLGNLLAGIQIAFTQPIRHDDVVIVENEWGVIEEITLTYVVVRIWDLRRLIVPIAYFLEKPFQNWTRTSSNLLGSVFLWVDYNVPLEKLRAELKRIVEKSPLWNGELQQIAVTNCDQKAMELRVLVSAASASLCWDLRVEIREKLLRFIQKKYPSSLPVLRAELKGR